MVATATSDELGLHRRLLAHDIAALAQIYDQYATGVFGVALRVTTDRHAAEDVTQDVLLDLWRRPEGFDPEREADLALSRAEERGPNRVEVYDEELRNAAIGRLGTEQMVRNAIAEDGLLVHYQPIIDLTTGHVVEAEAEALVRIQWRGQLLMPDVFIDVAEDSGQLADVDEWVLRKAVAQTAAWQRDLGPGHFGGIAVNITGEHLADSRFAQVLGDSLAEHELPPGSMSIEVTERVLMEASNSAIEGLGCDRGQGFLFRRAGEPETIGAVIGQRTPLTPK